MSFDVSIKVSVARARARERDDEIAAGENRQGRADRPGLSGYSLELIPEEGKGGRRSDPPPPPPVRLPRSLNRDSRLRRPETRIPRTVRARIKDSTRESLINCTTSVMLRYCSKDPRNGTLFGVHGLRKLREIIVEIVEMPGRDGNLSMLTCPFIRQISRISADILPNMCATGNNLKQLGDVTCVSSETASRQF